MFLDVNEDILNFFHLWFRCLMLHHFINRGNTEEAVALFSKAIELVRTETEMAQTFSLLEAAKAQGKVVKRLGIALPITPNF